MSKRQPQLDKSETVAQIPLACSDENAAVEFLEKQRWGDTPGCVHCGSVKPKPGPKPETLKIEGDWQAAVKKALQKKKPAGGWPKPKQ